MYVVSGHFLKRLMLMLFVGGQSSKGTRFKLKFQVHRKVKSWAVFGKPDSNRQKDKHGGDPLTQLQDPAVPASIPHNYTGPQIERQFSLLPDPLLFSSLCCCERGCAEHGGGVEVFRCEKRQFVKNLREHWSDDERITVKGLKDCVANSVIAEEE